MKKVLGVLTIIIGVLFGLWLGVYIMLFGGIVQIINNINPINAVYIAIGILRVLFCELAIFPSYLLIALGLYIFYKG